VDSPGLRGGTLAVFRRDTERSRLSPWNFLRRKFHKRHFRPGWLEPPKRDSGRSNGICAVSIKRWRKIGYRYRELHFTSQERNWDYARYHTEKIDLALRLALERRPKRARSAQPFLEEDLPAVFEAIQSRDATRMGRAMERLERACVECHRRENVLYFRDAVERLRDATSR
jgi:hypothetical protein